MNTPLKQEGVLPFTLASRDLAGPIVASGAWGLNLPLVFDCWC